MPLFLFFCMGYIFKGDIYFFVVFHRYFYFMYGRAFLRMMFDTFTIFQTFGLFEFVLFYGLLYMLTCLFTVPLISL